MKSFRHITPSLRLFHGPESLTHLGRELERLNSTRAVVFCGATMGRNTGLIELIQSEIGGRCAGIFTGVRAHSPLSSVEEASEKLKQLKADAVVVVGGGSAIVTARAASILLSESGDARTLCTSRNAAGELHSPKLLASKLPQLIIPTTPTTATVKAGSAVLDPIDGRRLALFDPKTRVQAVFLHPELLQTPSCQLVVSASLNTLAMAVEGLSSHSGDSISDAMLIHAVRLLVQYLPAAAHSVDVSLRSELMMASLMCGHGTDYTGAGIAIPLGHAVSAKFNIDNGIANAIVLPHVLRFYADAAKSGLDKLVTAFGGSLPRDGDPVRFVVDSLNTLFTDLRLPRRLRDVGVTRESLSELAAISMEDWFIRDSPRPVGSAVELQRVLETLGDGRSLESGSPLLFKRSGDWRLLGLIQRLEAALGDKILPNFRTGIYGFYKAGW